jgi:hypothetical protein
MVKSQSKSKGAATKASSKKVTSKITTRKSNRKTKENNGKEKKTTRKTEVETEVDKKIRLMIEDFEKRQELVKRQLFVKLTDGNEVLLLKREESINLEMKLNASKYGSTWKEIGDQLFEFGTGNDIAEILVNNYQFNYLTYLNDSVPI